MPAIIDMSLVDSGVLRAALMIWYSFAPSPCAIMCSIIYFFISPGEHCLCLLAHQTEACTFNILFHCAAMASQVTAALQLFFYFFFYCYPAAPCPSDHSVDFVFFAHILHHHNLKQSPCLLQSGEPIRPPRGEAVSSYLSFHSRYSATLVKSSTWDTREIVKTEVLLNSVTLTGTLSRGVHWSGMMRL